MNGTATNKKKGTFDLLARKLDNFRCMKQIKDKLKKNTHLLKIKIHFTDIITEEINCAITGRVRRGFQRNKG